MIDSCLLFLVCISFFGCVNSADKNRNSADKSRNSAVNIGVNAIGYNLSKPDRTILLPLILQEISGITLIDSTSVACIQDENGIVFIFDLLKNEITNQVLFHSAGDYEGIARADNTIYVLRSDGVLFQILNYKSSGSSGNIYSIGIPPSDYEGLCYDQKNHRLLIAPKSNPGHGPKNEKKHPVYAIDLLSGIFLGETVLEIDLTAINKFAADNKIITAGSDSIINFSPSAIGIHPVTDKLYVLSGAERMLFVFDMNGTIEYIERLDPGIFNAAEGISFFGNGDMMISNEGRLNPPSMLIFSYKRK